LSNPWGGILCLAAFVSTPAFLVFGPLVLTDIAVTFFSLLTLWSFASMWHLPSRRTMTSVGLFFAGALLSKFSSGLLLFSFLAFRLSLRLLPLPEVPTDKLERRRWRRLRGRYLWKAIPWPLSPSMRSISFFPGTSRPIRCSSLAMAPPRCFFAAF